MPPRPCCPPTVPTVPQNLKSDSVLTPKPCPPTVFTHALPPCPPPCPTQHFKSDYALNPKFTHLTQAMLAAGGPETTLAVVDLLTPMVRRGKTRAGGGYHGGWDGVAWSRGGDRRHPFTGGMHIPLLPRV